MSGTLYIDSNEPQSVQVITKTTIKDRQPSVDVESKGLKTSDFAYNDIAIERKEASDLAQSIKDRRLKEQTLRMLEDFEHSYIIVEDDPYDLKYSSLHDNSFIGTLVSRAEDGCRIIYTPDVEGTAYAINKIISKHEGGEEKIEELKKTNADTEDTKIAMLSCVEGISGRKAREIFEETKFETIKDIVDEHQVDAYEELQKVDGVGTTLSHRIVGSFD